jgi:hypothetical protein
LVLPHWHVWYPSAGSGVVASLNSSDYRAHDWDERKQRYMLTSDKLNQSIPMCVMQEWRVNRLNNAPFELYKSESFRPEGDPDSRMVLARTCQQ